MELQDLLDKAALSTGDKIIAIGDIVDRGPASPQVLDFFRHRSDTTSLMGNHERKHIRSFHQEIQPGLSQVISRWQFGDRYPDAIRFMESLPLYIELDEAILVHGGLEPGIPLEQQRDIVLCMTLSGEGYIDYQYHELWYRLYSGEKAVVFGHQDYGQNGQPFVYQDKIFGLDTSCVLGGRLTGLLLPDFQFISVPSKKNYWQMVRNDYGLSITEEEEKNTGHPPEMEWDASGSAAVAFILNYVDQENRRILDTILAQPGVEGLTPRQLALRYDAIAEKSPVNSLLHLARKGRLTGEIARKILHSPEQAKTIAQQLGIASD